MRRILTSLPYEKRIGLQGATNGLPIGDSVRRTLLLPVADTHLDDAVERVAGKLVRCDDAGSLLADAKSRGYSEIWYANYLLRTDDGATYSPMYPGYDHLEFWRPYHGAIGFVYVCNAAGVFLQELVSQKLTPLMGVRESVYLIATAQFSQEITVRGYHFR